MSTETAAASPRRLSAVLRGGEAQVTRLELFFDLVFVLAITQVTALMADEPTWTGLAKGVPALASATIVAAVLIVLIVIETRSYGDSRARIRNELRAGG